MSVAAKGHPCKTSVGKASDICKQILTLCKSSSKEDELPICSILLNEKSDHDDEELEKADLTSDKTSTQPYSMEPSDLLWSITNIPWELFELYKHFARGVQRGFKDIVSKVSSGGTHLYNDISNVMPTSGYTAKTPVSDVDINNYGKETTTKKNPSTGYSVDPPEEPQKTQVNGYFVSLLEKNGKSSGGFTQTSPHHSVSVYWPPGNKCKSKHCTLIFNSKKELFTGTSWSGDKYERKKDKDSSEDMFIPNQKEVSHFGSMYNTNNDLDNTYKLNQIWQDQLNSPRGKQHPIIKNHSQSKETNSKGRF